MVHRARPGHGRGSRAEKTWDYLVDVHGPHGLPNDGKGFRIFTGAGEPDPGNDRLRRWWVTGVSLRGVPQHTPDEAREN
jgi:hypothetical protein